MMNLKTIRCHEDAVYLQGCQYQRQGALSRLEQPIRLNASGAGLDAHAICFFSRLA
jgi:hypothetical protein